MAKINLKKLPKAVKVILAILPAVLVVALVVYFVIIPKQEQIDKLHKDIAKQESDIAKAQSMVQRLDQLKAENKKLRALLKELEAYLPEEGEISSLLKQIEDLGVEAQLEILTWKPSGRRKHASGIVFEVPVSVTLNGSYHKLGKFFGSLTKLDRIVNVKNIQMSSPSARGGEAVLRVAFSAVTFTAVPEPEPKK